MHTRELRKLDADLTEFVDELIAPVGRSDRRSSMRSYIEGLLLDGERKSMEPMARRLVEHESKVDPMRQRLQEVVTVSPWSDREMFGRLGRKIDSELPGTEALILDDTGFPKKGVHSVGVQRQYSGTLGRVDNCQVGVSLHLGGERGSCCIDMRLYLPVEWVNDRARRTKVGVPDDVTFKTKLEIALDEIDAAKTAGIRTHVILADAGFGDSTEFREGLAERGRHYVVGIQSTIKVWAPGTGPIAPVEPPEKTRGRRRTKYQTGDNKPLSVVELATSSGRGKLKELTWREGARGPQRSCFGALRVRTANRHTSGKAPGEEVWLVWAWPKNASKPAKFWLSNLPATTSLKRLVYLAKLRWRVERDYQEMKGEVGLDHYEGRTWRGWHHHTTLVALAHAFLTLQRVLSPPIHLEEVDAA
jgi:SRSO17 transposase